MPVENYRFHDHIKLAHYANAACDIEFKFPMGFKELEGIHSRTDFDLKQHEEHSGKKLRYFDPETNESYVPYVVETSIGLDRMFLAMLSAAYEEEKLENGEERVVLRIPAPLAPGESGRAAADQEGRPAREGPRHHRLAEALAQLPVRREGQHRQALPPAGRHRHALLHHRGPRFAHRRQGDHPRPRYHAAGARGHQRPGAHREREGGSAGGCQAAFIKRSFGLKLPDAVIAATALHLKAPLITRDKGFQKVVELIEVRMV
jgi:hypothetical protein